MTLEYDPATGTFICRDPLSGSINDPASMNGYNYADDDPITGSDPSGECDWFRSFTDPNYSYSEARADCARDEYLANFAQQNGYGLGISTLIRLGNIAALNDELSAINSGKEFIADLFSNCSEVSGPAWRQLAWNVFVNLPLLAMLSEGSAPTEPDFSDLSSESEVIGTTEENLTEHEGGVNTVSNVETNLAGNTEDLSTTDKPDLHRPYIRSRVWKEVENRAPKTDDGRFIDPNTREPFDGPYDLGHVAGHEFWREKAQAQAEGLTQQEFNNRMNNPDYYQIEAPSSNRGHLYEQK